MTTGLPELLHHHRSGQPVGAVEHGGVDRAARRLDRRLPRPHARAAGWRRSSRPGRRGGLGAARQRLRRHHALPARRTPGTWAPTCPGKPRVFLPYIGGVDRYRKACDEVVEPRLPRLRLRRARRRALQRRRHPPRAAGRRDRARAGRRSWAAAARNAVGRGRPRPHGGAWRRSDRPAPRWARSSTATLPGAAGPLAYRLYRPHERGSAPDRRLLPRRRLGARQPRLRRSVLPRPLRALVGDRRVGRLSPRARGALPGGRRRRLRRRSLDRGQRRDARRRAGAAGGLRLERRRQHRRRRLSAGARCRRSTHRRPGAGDAGDRLRLHARLVRRQRRRLWAHRRPDALVLGSLRRRGRAHGTRRRRRCAPPICPACRRRWW